MSSTGVQSLSAMRAEAAVRGCAEWSSSAFLPQQLKTAHTEPDFCFQNIPNISTSTSECAKVHVTLNSAFMHTHTHTLHIPPTPPTPTPTTYIY